MSANEKQVAGNHYRNDECGEQHWDRVYRLYGRGYFVGCATKYIERYHLKNGKEDLEKAIHFLEKLIELEYSKEKDTLKSTYPDFRDRFQVRKYPDDYQEQLAKKMEKARDDAMNAWPLRNDLVVGIPEHLRDTGEPQSQGYVNQDGPVAKESGTL